MKARHIASACIAVAGVGLRAALSYFAWGPRLAERVELSTPLHSIFTVAEGFHLKNMGMSPYTGSAFHAPPLVLPLLSSFTDIGDLSSASPFIAFDLASAYLIYMIAFTFCRLPKRSKAGMKRILSSGWSMYDIQTGQLKEPAPNEASPASGLPDLCAAVYFLNPLAIASCVAGSLSGLETLCILLGIYGATVQKPSLAAFGVAGATYMSALPLVLCIPLMLLLAYGLEDCPLEYQPEARVRFAQGLGRLGVLHFAAALVSFAVLLAYFSSIVLEEHGGGLVNAANVWWSETALFVLQVEDLKPNLGLYWYLFSEMFVFFRPLFLAIFQAQPLVMALPLVIRFRHRPLFVTVVILGLVTIYKPYPVAADAVLYVSLLCMFRADLTYMRSMFVIVNAFLSVAVLGPLFWYLWIYAGTANANFYYAITLVYAAAQGMLLVDAASSTIRRDYLAKH